MNEKIKNKLQRELMLNISDNLFIESVNQKKGSDDFLVGVGASLPKIIYDDYLEKRYIKFLKYSSLTTLHFKLNKHDNFILKSKVRIGEKIENREARMRFKVEELVLDEIHSDLINVPLIKNNLRPIYTILNTIFKNRRFTDVDVKGYSKPSRLKKYLGFLVGLDIIRKDSRGNYVEGNIPIQIQKDIRSGNEDNVLAHAFGYALKHGRKYLRDELNLRMVDTYLRIVTTYYLLAKRMNTLIQINKNTFAEELYNTYGRKIPESKFLGYLEELSSIGIFNDTKSNYFGNESLLRKITVS
ncbi:MAG: hypothetical protein ACOCQ4_02395 [bacterium]